MKATFCRNHFPPYKKSLSPKETELALCKWELIRRNKKYQKFFEKYKNIYSTLNKKNINIFMRNSIPVIKELERKFGINYLLNPNIKITPTMLKKNETLRTTLFNLLVTPPVIDTTDIYENSNLIPEHKLAQLNNIELKINLAYSRTVIVDEIKNIIESWKTLKKNYRQNSKMNFRPKDVEYYLKVWDLKNAQPNLTYKSIAKKVYPKSEERERILEDRVAKEYKACCKLIDGGYRKITL